MDGKQGLVGALGLGLVAVNFWTSTQRQKVGGVLWTGAAPADAHSALLQLAGELLLVGVLVLLAGVADGLANAALAVFTALAVLWAISYYGKAGAPAPAPQPAKKGG